MTIAISTSAACYDPKIDSNKFDSFDNEDDSNNNDAEDDDSNSNNDDDDKHFLFQNNRPRERERDSKQKFGILWMMKVCLVL